MGARRKSVFRNSRLYLWIEMDLTLSVRTTPPVGLPVVMVPREETASGELRELLVKRHRIVVVLVFELTISAMKL